MDYGFWIKGLCVNVRAYSANPKSKIAGAKRQAMKIQNLLEDFRGFRADVGGAADDVYARR